MLQKVEIFYPNENGYQYFTPKSSHGAYERMYVWYAYQLDIEKNGKPTKIATGCKPGPCSLEQLNKFINQAKGEVRLTGFQAGLSLDHAAGRLEAASTTGQYHVNKILGGGEMNDVERMFQDLG
jgi:hypothetical protein